MISAYVDFIRIRFLTMLAYRVNYYSGIVIYAINIGAYYFMWKAIYGDAEQLGGFTAGQMTTYVAVSWMARAFYFNNLDREISNDIRDGSVAVQMTRPYSYIMVKMMQGFGEGLFRLLLFMAPGMVVVTLIFPIELPTDPVLWMIFLVMIWFSFLINSQINVMTGLFAFFVENNEGLMRMKRVTVDLLSGVVVPIAFFPGWASEVLKWLPFQAITYLPGSVFTGRIAGSAVWEALLVQAAWFVALIAPIALMWRAARKRLFVQGG
ncbi:MULTISPECIES: ABC transporter permease [Cohnella]|uniref:ABC transporter permease n=1 Tax=Cohnella TaxID=329857 RepID=UPI00038139C0|nr:MULTISPECIES: ABC-2 family transporter protein [Cohnella]REK61567.1 MAG: daunorubicin ABC transporter permease [Cohnella sp.]